MEFELQPKCNHVPWQGELVPLALKIKDTLYPILSLSYDEILELREDHEEFYAAPIFVALENGMLELYPSPNINYTVVSQDGVV